MSAARPDDPAAADDLLQLLATTRAIRRYTDDPVPDDDLSAILFAATRAPSGSNAQPFRFVVLRDDPGRAPAVAARRLIGEASRRMWADKVTSDGYGTGSGADPSSRKARTAATMQAFVDGFESIPVVILACARRRRPAPDETLGASVYPACQNLLLAARALGYGGVMMMWHRAVEDELRAVLGIPAEVMLAATITLGRPAGSHGPVRRRPLEEFVADGAWDEPADWVREPPGTEHTAPFVRR